MMKYTSNIYTLYIDIHINFNRAMGKMIQNKFQKSIRFTDMFVDAGGECLV